GRHRAGPSVRALSRGRRAAHRDAGEGRKRRRDDTAAHRRARGGAVSVLDLERYVAERRALVDAALERLLPAEDVAPPTVHRAMRYSVFAGGKRLRPILVVAGAEAVGGAAEEVLPTACAIEMIHTYSLIHDDLPAMDDDDYRRGHP